MTKLQTSEMIHPEKHHSTEFLGTKLVQLGAVKGFIQHPGFVEFMFDGATFLLQFINEKMVRFKILRGHEQSLGSTAAVQLRICEDTEVVIEEGEDQVTCMTKAMTILIIKSTFELRAYNREGALFYTLNHIVHLHTGQTIAYMKKFSDDHFYGLGEKTGFLDKNGEKYRMWNSDVYAPHVPEITALYVSIPYLLHTHNGLSYGVFLDHPGESFFDMQSNSDTYQIQTMMGDFDAYLIAGTTMKDIIINYTALTGRLHLPPAWSLGYHQSRYSYMNQDEVMELARKFREKMIPCDAIHLDIHYMNEYRVFTFDEERFPDPKQMVEQLKELGFHLVPIVDPGVKRDPKYRIYREGIEQDRFCKRIEGDVFLGAVWPGESAFPDFTQDETARWWGEKHEFYTNLGIQAIWNDMNEPAVFNEIKTMDLDVIHTNNGASKTHAELHNLYGMLMTKATYEGMRRLLGDQRPFLLTRSGYAGIQRYAAVWTGDNRSFWEHMELAVPMVLNMGLSGLPFAGADIGGFAHDVSKELLVRWTQMGALLPFSRNHSAMDTIRQEPWQFGAEIEGMCRQAINLRYRWLPYLYTLFHEASQSGIPVVRPLLLEFPEDTNVLNLSDQFLLGTDILVAPVFRPGMRKRLVYLPQGKWIHFWSQESYEGPRHLVVDSPLDQLPLFIRYGAIIPEHPLLQFISFQAIESLTVTIYGVASEASQTYVLYEDDGVSFAHERGAFNQLAITVQSLEQGGLKISCHYVHKGYQPAYGSRIFRLKHLEDAEQYVIKNLPRVDLEQLAQYGQGYAFDSHANEVVIKLSTDWSEDSVELHR